MFRLTVTTTRESEPPVAAASDYSDYYGRYDAMTALLYAFNDVADGFDRGYLTAVRNYGCADSFEHSVSRDGVTVRARVVRVYSELW